MHASSPANLNQPTAYFPALTGVRALAAYLVYAHHVRQSGTGTPVVLEKLIAGAGAGVTIFFVLSGFLIAYRYESVLKEKTISFGGYMLRRFARIYPLYLVLSVFTLWWQKNDSGWEWFLNLSLLKAFFEDQKFSGIVQGWSLTVEETFYLAAPILFLAFRKIGVNTIIILLVIGSGVVFLANLANSGSFMQNYDLMLGWTLFGRAFEFYCGYRLAKNLKDQVHRERKGSKFTWLGCVGIICGLVIIGFAGEQKFIFSFPFSPNLLINNFLFPFAIVCCFFGLLTESTLFSNLLSSRLFQVLGKSSYAFYLIHFGWFFEVFYFHVYPSRVSTFFLLNICAIAIYYLFEEPVNQYLRRKFDALDLRNYIEKSHNFFSPKA